MSDGVWGFAIVTAVVLAAVGLLFGGLMLLARQQCINDASNLDTAWRWKAIGGCYLEHEGRYVPRDNYRVNG